MFKKISYKIALQFTGFVLLLFLVNGIVFFAADFANVRRMENARLSTMAEGILQKAEWQPAAQFDVAQLSPMMKDRVRVMNAEGKPIHSGVLFNAVPFTQQIGVTRVTADGDQYMVFTRPVERAGNLVGYVQVGEISRLPDEELRLRIHMYLLVSLLVSLLTFWIGIFFARRSLRPAERMMEQLEQFTQDASHELRTPLAALGSSLDLALKNKKYREGIESAKDDLKQISSLVERLLELARLDKLLIEHQQVDLSGLVTQSVERHHHMADAKGMKIITQIAPAVTISGDPHLIRQAIGNLLSNAIKFSNDKNVTVTLTDKMLSVADKGTGIDRDALPHIFDRFFQEDTSRARGGYGLGLALVKRVTELHGWDISVKSTEGEGSTFTLRFKEKDTKASS